MQQVRYSEPPRPTLAFVVLSLAYHVEPVSEGPPVGDHVWETLDCLSAPWPFQVLPFGMEGVGCLMLLC